MNRFYRALEARYQAQVEEALAVLDLYFNKSVGIGEHENILGVLDDAVDRLDQAKSRLLTLQQLFPPQEENSQGDVPAQENVQ
jgi:hypothetical protein